MLQELKEQTRKLQDEVDELVREEQKEKQQDLKDYEKYTKTKEYTESQARSKLGLLYDNETIFKEK